MVSISTRREDWNIIDPVRDIKYLADHILKEEEKAARAAEQPVRKGLSPQILTKLMPGDMKVSVDHVDE